MIIENQRQPEIIRLSIVVVVGVVLCLLSVVGLSIVSGVYWNAEELVLTKVTKDVPISVKHSKSTARQISLINV